MKFSVNWRPQAVDDLERIHEDYQRVRSGLGYRFLDVVRKFLERLEHRPFVFGTVWRDVRAARLRPFRHIIYFVVVGDRVEIIAILHGSRIRDELKKRR